MSKSVNAFLTQSQDLDKDNLFTPSAVERPKKSSMDETNSALLDKFRSVQNKIVIK